MKKLSNSIKNEIDSILSRPLYVFDFDETLAHNDGGVRIEDANGKTRPLTQEEYYVYKLKKGEKINFDDYDDIDNLRPDYLHLALLKKHIPNSVILSARTPTTMIKAKKWLARLDIEVPTHGVGVDDNSQTHVITNANRKKEWIRQEILDKKLTYVEFWDDNPINIKAVEELQEEMKNVIILVHLVNLA